MSRSRSKPTWYRRLKGFEIRKINNELGGQEIENSKKNQNQNQKINNRPKTKKKLKLLLMGPVDDQPVAARGWAVSKGVQVSN